MEVTAYYGISQSVILTNSAVTGYTVSPTAMVDGVTEVTISYTESRKTCTCTQAVSVAKTLSNITVTTNPTTTTYEYGDTLATADAVITATYSDGSTANVTNSCSFSPSTLTTISNTQAITVSYTEDGTTKTTSFNVVVNRKRIPAPTWKTASAPTYNATTFNVASSTYWNNWNTTYFTYSGCSSSEAGNHTATFTPTANYRWSNGSTAAIDVIWSISKATRTLTLNTSSISIDLNNLSGSVVATYLGDGTLTYSPSSLTGLVIAINGNTITFTGDGQTDVSQEFTVTIGEGTNYLAATQTVTVTAAYITWEFGAGSGEAADAEWFEGLKNYLTTKSGSSLTTTAGGSILGATKTVTLSSAVSGTTTHLIRVIGMDQDADNTVTFQTVNSLTTASKFSSLGSDSSNYANGSNYHHANNLIFDGNSSGLCKQYYDAFPGKASIMRVNKGTCTSQVSGKNGTATYREQYVWIPSEGEVGLNNYSSLTYGNWTTTNGECTYGKKFKYSYYTDNDTRKKWLGDEAAAAAEYSGNGTYWWTRGHYYNIAGNVCAVFSDGSADNYYYWNSCGVAPAFVIG